MNPSNICFFIFDLSFIATEIPLRQCARLNCEETHMALCLPQSVNRNDKVVFTNQIKSYIRKVEAFLEAFSRHAVILPLPLPPSQLYCNIKSFVTKEHKTYQWIYKQAHFAIGKQHNWRNYLTILEEQWNFLLRNYYGQFSDAMSIILKYQEYIYINPIFKIFTFEDQFNGDISAYEKWIDTVNNLILTITTKDVHQYVQVSHPCPVNSLAEESKPNELQKVIPLQQQNYNLEIDSFHNIARRGPAISNAPTNASIEKLPSPKISALLNTATKQDIILITGFLSTFPISFLLDFTSEASKEARVLEQKAGSLKMMFPNEIAELVVNKLNHVRIGDTYIKAKFENEPIKHVQPDTKQYSFMSAIFKKTYYKWSQTIASSMEKQLLNGLDVATFKTSRCLTGCRDIDACRDFHGAGDQRRNPINHKYSEIMCMKVKDEGDCDSGIKCKFSHNLYERMYHPINFQTVLCMTSISGNVCLKYPFCKFAHIDTPEVFFTKYWTDLIVYGLHNTFDYIAGAIKACTKLPESKYIKIFCVSSNKDFLKLMKLALRKIAKEYNMLLCLLDGRDSREEMANIYFGTPFMYMSSRLMVHVKRFAPSALIIDDAEAIFKDDIETENLHSFFQRLRRSLDYTSLQKVFVVDTYSEKSSGTLSRFFSLPLKTVNKTFSDANNAAAKETTRVTAASLKRDEDVLQAESLAAVGKPEEMPSTLIRPQVMSSTLIRPQVMSSTYKPSFTDKRCQSIPPADNPTSSGYKTQEISSTYKQAIINKKAIVYGKIPFFKGKLFKSTENENETQNSKKGARKSDKMSSFVNNAGQSGNVNKNFMNNQQGNHSTEADKYEKKKRKISRWNPIEKLCRPEEPKHKSQKIQLQEPPSSQEQSEKMKDFMETKIKLIMEYEEELRVYRELPEIHPDYESVYESFLKFYRREIGKEEDEAQLNAKWIKYWGVYLNSGKTDRLKRKMEILKDTLGIKEEQKQEHLSIVGQNTEEEFTIAKTLDILEELKEKFGVLGYALQEILNLARKSDQCDDVLEVFADRDHVQLCKMIIEKMKCLKSTSRYTSPVYDMAIQWTNTLLEKAAQRKGTG